MVAKARSLAPGLLKAVRAAALGLAIWGFLVLLFTAIGYVDALNADRSIDLRALTISNAKGAGPWLVLGPTVFLASARMKRPFDKLYSEVVFAVGFLVLTYTVIGVYTLMVRNFEIYFYGSTRYGTAAFGQWLLDAIIFGAAYFSGLAVRLQNKVYEERIVRLGLEKENRAVRREIVELEAKDFELRFVSHFLLNAFSNIIAMTRLNQSGEASSATLKLGQILNYIYKHGKSQSTARLADEIDYINQYLEFQRIRFPRAEHTIRIEGAETPDQRVPTLLLQILVENCFKHGMNSEGNLRIDILIAAKADQIVIEVINTTPRKATGEDGEGLRLIRLKLKKQFGDAFTFSTRLHDAEFVARISFPRQDTGT